ncbi:MAG: ATP-binding protein [Xenococcaceae cyanobacterium]
MATLAEIIQREVNPFDPVTLKTGNFWTDDKQKEIPTVTSIHQEVIQETESFLHTVAKDHHTRTLLLMGDSGCGKSYLLARLKQNFNHQAFFAYIDPCPSSDCIWRHTLRYTVDSLMHAPAGEKESQLLLWLKNLANFRDRSLMRQLLGAKGLFVLNFRSSYPTGIFQPKDFFTVLYQLTKPEFYFLACDWLRGENLDEKDLKKLGVNTVIDSEESARGILGNFGRISEYNQPIVLCFDQVETYRHSDGSFDISSVFNVNTTLHNSNFKNFLVIISIIRNQFIEQKDNLHQSELARLEKTVTLKQIDLNQVEALWSSRLAYLHSQAQPKPQSQLEPLNTEQLQQYYLGGKANLRDSLALASKLFLAYKTGQKDIEKVEENIPASFHLLWQQELQKIKNELSRIRQFSSQELIDMLQQVAIALQVDKVKNRFLSGKYASYSFSYKSLEKDKLVGVLWCEEPSLKSFVFAMKACDKAKKIYRNCSLILLRAETVGSPQNKGYQLYKKIFRRSPHRHLQPSLEDVSYLKTYQKLANEAIAGDLVLGFQTITLLQLQSLVCHSQVLAECNLLKELAIIPSKNDTATKELEQPKVKELLLNLAKVHKIIGKQKLIEQASHQLGTIDREAIEQSLAQLQAAKQIAIVNPNAPTEEQIIMCDD